MNGRSDRMSALWDGEDAKNIGYTSGGVISKSFGLR